MLAVLSVPEDTHYEYPEEVSTSTMGKKFSRLSYSQLIYCLTLFEKHEFQKYAAQELGKRSYTDPNACDQIYEGAGITDLVELLKDKYSLMLKLMATAALINITLDPQSRVDICEAGGANLLVDLLTVTHPKILDQVSWCLVNLTKDRSIKEMIVCEAGAMSKLSDILNPKEAKMKETYERLFQDPGLRHRFAQLICNLLDDAPKSNLAEFRKEGLISPLFRWVVKYKADDEMTRLLLASIYHLIQDTNNRNDFIKVSGLSLIIRMVMVSDKPHHLYIMWRILDTLSVNQEYHKEMLNVSIMSGKTQITALVTLLSLLEVSPPQLLVTEMNVLANLSNSEACRTQIVQSNAIMMMCRMLDHDIESVAAAACVVVTNLSLDGPVCGAIAELPSIPSSLLRLTLSDNRTETQILGISAIRNLAKHKIFAIRLIQQGGMDRLLRMSRTYHNAAIIESALCSLWLIVNHGFLSKQLVVDVTVLAIGTFLHERTDSYVKYLSLLIFKSFLCDGKNADLCVDLLVTKGSKTFDEIDMFSSSSFSPSSEADVLLQQLAMEMEPCFTEMKKLGPPLISPRPTNIPSLTRVSSSFILQPDQTKETKEEEERRERERREKMEIEVPPLDGVLPSLPALSEEVLSGGASLGSDVAPVETEQMLAISSSSLSSLSLSTPESPLTAGRASPADGSGMKITMKCAFGKVVKMMRLDSSLSLDGLSDAMSDKFSLKITSIKYKDDDGDFVCLENEEDLEFFKECFYENPKKKFEVHIDGEEAAKLGGGPPPPPVSGGPPPPPAGGGPPPPPPPGPPPPPVNYALPVKLNIKRKGTSSSSSLEGSSSSSEKKSASSSAASFQEELRKRLQGGVSLKKVEVQAPKKREVRKRAAGGGGMQDMMSQLMNVLDERRSKVKDDDGDQPDDWDE